MIKAIVSQEKLHYFCGECGKKLDRVKIAKPMSKAAMPQLLLQGVWHVVLRCPICFTLASVRDSDCGNE